MTCLFNLCNVTRNVKKKFLFIRLWLYEVLSAGSDKNHAGDSTWWVTDLADFHLSERF